MVGELFVLGSATPNPCVAYSDNLMYFIYPSYIITFDTSSNKASTQTLSAGPTGDNVCAQQPGTDLVVMGKVSSVTDGQGQNFISSKYVHAQIEPFINNSSDFQFRSKLFSGRDTGYTIT